MNQPENAVIVAVGAQGADAAISFAIAEATRAHRPVHLVHVLQIPAAEAYAGVYGGALETASKVLDDAMVTARELAGGRVPVTGEVVDHGWVTEDLVRRSREARMVVLQHRDLTTWRRLVTGSISSGVVARAHAPVVSVPEKWQPPTGPAVVTVAVQDADGATLALRTAFEEARERSAKVVVLHASALVSGYDDLAVDQVIQHDWEARTLAELVPALAPLRSRFPQVAVDVVVRHETPVEAILEAAERSDLVVIARRHHLLPLGSHLGPVARAVLKYSTAPVLVTPELDDSVGSSRRVAAAASGER